ncbi:hypothetical protein GH733_005960, partial [Mirounga leonina]
MTAQGLTPSQLLLLLVVAGAAGAAGARWRGEGTTPHLQSIILGRCAEYVALLNPDQRHSIPRDKSLFWEDNHLLVTSYSENARRLVPLCNVLYGTIGDFLSWCRQENASGLDYQSCPTSEDCENNPVDSFWKRASMQGILWRRHCENPGRETEENGFSVQLPVKLLKCVDHSTHPDCALNSAAASTQREVPPLWAEPGASHIIPFLVALASAVQMIYLTKVYMRKEERKKEKKERKKGKKKERRKKGRNEGRKETS